ncbi:carboxylate-amine ligase [Streptomyces sp. G45]|uniref:carboxylate-amine ligase n=1 Tax=Streptomyces sp. G45 TaxID=3406627 RepID=UPI003C134558
MEGGQAGRHPHVRPGPWRWRDRFLCDGGTTSAGPRYVDGRRRGGVLPGGRGHASGGAAGGLRGQGRQPHRGSRHVVPELAQTQIETIGGVCADARELRAETDRLRQCAARAAREVGCLLVACGTVPLGDPGPPPVLDRPRYHTIAARFGSVLNHLCVNACHVHVGVPDREEAVQVVNHLRPWLPLLLSLTANSPFVHGRDTGHASWRTMLWDRWPTAGPPPRLRSVDHYEQLVATLVDSGAAVDPAMVYWSARPSRHVPTVEVRAADVLPDTADTVAFALLVRALVASVLADVRGGVPAPGPEDAVLRAAVWRAARHGMSGRTLALPLPDPTRSVPVWQLAEHLVGRVEEHLRAAGDLDTVRQWFARLRAQGTGADRQRAAFQRHGGLQGVVDLLAVPVREAADRPADLVGGDGPPGAAPPSTTVVRGP